MIVGTIFRNTQETLVTINGNPLPMSELARAKSPTGFAWGYAGSGPAALAHSILSHRYGSLIADTFFQTFKANVLARLPQDMSFEFTEEFVDGWVKWAIKDLPTRGNIDDRMIEIGASFKSLDPQTCLNADYAIMRAVAKRDACYNYSDSHELQRLSKCAMVALAATGAITSEDGALSLNEMHSKLYIHLGLHEAE